LLFHPSPRWGEGAHRLDEVNNIFYLCASVAEFQRLCALVVTIILKRNSSFQPFISRYTGSHALVANARREPVPFH
jgi:hypothetical protein